MKTTRDEALKRVQDILFVAQERGRSHEGVQEALTFLDRFYQAERDATAARLPNVEIYVHSPSEIHIRTLRKALYLTPVKELIAEYIAPRFPGAWYAADLKSDGETLTRQITFKRRTKANPSPAMPDDPALMKSWFEALSPAQKKAVSRALLAGA